MTKKQTLAITGLLCALLAGCGGGSDDTGQSSSSGRPDFGAWQTTAGGSVYSFLVGTTGETWGTQIGQNGGTFFLYHGQQTVSSGGGPGIAGSYLSYDLAHLPAPNTAAAPVSVSYTGQVQGTTQAQSSLNLVFDGGGALNYSYFNSVPQTGTQMDFQGSWAGSVRNNLPGSLTSPGTMVVLGNSVSFPAAGPSGCQVTGNLTQPAPFIGDTAMYLFSGQFSAQCGVQGGVQVGGASITGLVTADPASAVGGTQNLLMLYAVTTDQQVGMIFIGSQ